MTGEFDGHHHENGGEAFWVLSGSLFVQLRDSEGWLEEAELLVVPKRVRHRPVAPDEMEVALIEGRIDSAGAISRSPEDRVPGRADRHCRPLRTKAYRARAVRAAVTIPTRVQPMILSLIMTSV